MGNLCIGDFMRKKIKPILLILFFLVIYIYVCSITLLPNNLVVFEGEKLDIKTLYGIRINAKDENFSDYKVMQTATNLSEKVSDNVGTVNLSLELFGTIP